MNCVNIAVTDSDLPEEYVVGLRERGIELLLAEKTVDKME